jgi:simple sugar transport system substrate-binding protein
MKKFLAALATTVALVALTPAADAAKIAVIAGSAQDAFFNKIKKGVDDAAKVVEGNGGSVTYLTVPNYDNFGPDLVGLINTAISQGVDGIAIPIWVPDAQVPALQEAQKKGIKIMLYNTIGGDGDKDKIGAYNYFGTDEKLAGVRGGEYLAKAGSKKMLCVIQVPGAVNLETRCNGLEEGAKANGAEIIRLPLPANLDGNAAGTTEAIKAELLKDPSIDAVFTLASAVTDAAALAIEQAGVSDKVKLGSTDLSASILDRIKNGKQALAIDQQPYLQSFLAVTMLANTIDWGTDIATDPVLTGPAIIDASNVDATMAGVAAGAR